MHGIADAHNQAQEPERIHPDGIPRIRSEYRKQLVVKSINIETEKLFRILLLAILRTFDQHR
jgi:hypothetical protein